MPSLPAEERSGGVSETLVKIRSLVALGSWRPTQHALLRLQERDLLLQDVVAGRGSAVVIEDYLTDPRGPSVLLLCYTPAKLPLHMVWGIPIGNNQTASLVTVYVPNTTEWMKDNLTRRKM